MYTHREKKIGLCVAKGFGINYILSTMRNFALSPEELLELHTEHRLAMKKKEVKLAYRINAMILLGTGWKLKEVSKALLLDEETLRSYVEPYREDGIEGLEDHYSGRNCMLSAVQCQDLEKHLDTHLCLSTNEVIAYVAEHYGITYSVSGMNALLHRLGYVYKKPKVVPGRADEQAQREFLEDYETISRNLGKDEVLYFMDGAHPTHNTMPSYGWIKKGEERQIKSNSGRQRLNINGALDVIHLRVHSSFEPTLNGDSTIELCKTIEKANPTAGRIYLILDNAKQHHSKAVKDYFASSRIIPLYLPPYSPNLNLIERLWKFFNKKILYNRYYEKFEQFKEAAHQFFDDLSPYRDQLRTLLAENFKIISLKT